MTRDLTAVRQEVNNLDSSVVVQELDLNFLLLFLITADLNFLLLLVMNIALYGLL